MASCRPLQGAAEPGLVHDGLSPELGAVSRGRCLCITCQVFALVTLWSHCLLHSVTLCLSGFLWLLHESLYASVPELGGVHMWAHLPCYLGVRAGVCRRSSGVLSVGVSWAPRPCFLPSPACPQEGWGGDML